MDARTVERIEDWESEPLDGGLAGLHRLADREFTGAVTAGGVWAFLLNGRVVGVFDGSLESIGDASGTAHRAPDPGVVLLFAMQELGGETRAQYYTEDTPLSAVDETLSEGGFTGYVELSERVLSGDYYLVYYGGRSMSVAFVGSSDHLETGDEAFERADDEVGLYEVVDVPIEVHDIPEAPESPATGTAVAGGDQAGEGAGSDGSGPAAASAGESTADDESASGGRDAGGLSADSPAGSDVADRDESSSGETAGSETPVGTAIEDAEASAGEDADTDADAGGSAVTSAESDAPSAGGTASEDPGATAGESGDPIDQADSGAGQQDRTAGRADSDAGQSDSRSGTDRADDTPGAGADEAATARSGVDSTDAVGTDSSDASTSADQPQSAGSPDPDAAEASRPAEGQADSDDPAAGGSSAGEPGAGSASTGETTESADPGAPATEGAEGSGTADAADASGGQSGQGDPFRAEERWRQTRTIPALSPEVDDGGPSLPGTTSSIGGADEGATTGSATDAETGPSADGPEAGSEKQANQTVENDGVADAGGPLRERVTKLQSALDERETELAELRERAESLEADREELAAERDRLQERVEELREQLSQARADAALGGDASGDTSVAQTTLTPADALEGTTLFVRYASKGQPTLADIDGGADETEVNTNLRLDTHTDFDSDAAAVADQPFDQFLESTAEYAVVEWFLRELPYEIRESGHQEGLADVYGILPEIDRAQLRGDVAVADGDETERVDFDVVLRDKMGTALAVIDISEGRDPVTDDAMTSLVESATSIATDDGDLGAAISVTESFFRPEALETAMEATGGGLLSRSSKEGYVRATRNSGYHLLLVERRNGSFYVSEPDL